MKLPWISVLAALALLGISAAWYGFVGLVFVLGAALGLLVVVALGASLMSIGLAMLPVARVPIRYNLRNLQARWKSTVTTALAFTLVVALLTVMLAFVQGMQQLTQGSGQPGNIVVLSQGAVDEAFSNLPPDISVLMWPRQVQELIRRDQADSAGPGNFWSVKEVYVVANQELPPAATGEERERFLQIRGVDDPRLAGMVHGIELEQGTWFAPRGINARTGHYEIVLGDGMARILGADQGRPLVPGDAVDIGPESWHVVGIMKPNGSVFGCEIWANDQLVARYFGNMKDGAVSYNSFVVRVKDSARVREAAEQIRTVTIQGNLEAFPEQEYYTKHNQTTDQFLAAIAVVAAMMAFGGTLGIMNTMFAAISARTRDIGVLRLLGFTRWQILRSFLLESIVLALLGAVLGCLLGSLAHGWTATSIVSSDGISRTVVFSLAIDSGILAAGMLIALVSGAVGGFIPAVVSMRLQPLESLR
jgi:ABC-type lipoprotein release transport system permease subunit